MAHVTIFANTDELSLNEVQVRYVGGDGTHNDFVSIELHFDGKAHEELRFFVPANTASVAHVAEQLASAMTALDRLAAEWVAAIDSERAEQADRELRLAAGPAERDRDRL